MSNSSKRSSLVAHVEDAADEDAVEGISSTRKYAMSEAPAKERPNTSKSRADRSHALSRSTSSSAGAGLTDSDSTARSSEKRSKEAVRPPRREPSDTSQRDPKRRERRPREDEARPRRARNENSRPPPSKHSLSMPVVQQQPGGYVRGRVEHPAFYGVRQPAASGTRPRAQTRPVSYYAGQPPGPPMVGPGWPPGGPNPGGPFPVGSFPPPPLWSGAGPPTPGFGPPPPSPVGQPPPGYLDSSALGSSPHSRLKHRFESRLESRPSSALGFRGPPAHDSRQDDFSDEPPPRVSRRLSRTKRADQDAMRMPPPSYIPKRPQSALPPTTSFRPPPIQRPPSRQNQSRPPPLQRRSAGYEDVTYDDSSSEASLGDDPDQGLFHDISPNASYDQRRAVVSRQRRASVVYEQPDYDLVPAAGRARRASMYGPGPGGVSLGDSKLNAALKYQDDVNGGSQVPLTAETLRKVMRRGGVPSSQSTRSSGSRDDSEYRRSNTTGITRSSYGNDEFTIKVPGNSVVRLQGGAEIECSNEGGEITWSSRAAGSRAGSDRASTVFPQLEDSRRIGDGRHHEDPRRLEDPPMRMERKALPHRPRAPSQADSQSRGYAPTYAPYEPAFAGGNYF
ncbi:uncharacterized protein HRG_09873 [Hirsutella rhossiliensis]|uniref:Uncharacterized protein n=1 Tax=Hirsutella rhossiliensis TaxID=111463 RepID=A0A9P8MMA1_9HYPO|nr:uncharacterized protein HRG_09873 [Hirsutella rhossiliensis]KAH0958828.1 hypothetical protein HRG_09873 [Hirsutella rhossiliensis]